MNEDNETDDAFYERLRLQAEIVKVLAEYVLAPESEPDAPHAWLDTPPANVQWLWPETRLSADHEHAAIGWIGRDAEAAASDIVVEFTTLFGTVQVRAECVNEHTVRFSSEDSFPDKALTIQMFYGHNEALTVVAMASNLSQADGVVVSVPFDPSHDAWEFRLGLE